MLALSYMYVTTFLQCTAAFNVSLELQGGHCSDQLTLICRHSDIGPAPLWIHNGTVESGEVLSTAFPGAVYTVLTRTEHTITITGVDNVRALDGCVFQCAYQILGTLFKSNAVKYSFIPPGQSCSTFGVVDVSCLTRLYISPLYSSTVSGCSPSICIHNSL